MEQSSIDMTPFKDFETASRAVLNFLRGRIDMGLWMMTRTEGADWIVLQAHDQTYGVEDGAVFQWADSYCSRMVLGGGPRVAPSAADVPVFAEALINEQVEIGAYIGVPVCKDDGSLFGTLCAIDPRPRNESIQNELPLVELCGKFLGTILSNELKAVEQDRALKKSQWEAMTDSLTGLPNRRGWDSVIAREEARARRYGTPIGIIIIDLDGLKEVNDTQGHAKGDELIRSAAQVLKISVREGDVIARLGGDEFGVMAIECKMSELTIIFERIRSSLSGKGVTASVGEAMRNPRLGLLSAISEADQKMYADKSTRRTRR